MEKDREKPARRILKTGRLCIPRLKPASSAAATVSSKTRRFTPVSLLDRFREAVFRLIMISALSSSSRAGSPGPSPSSKSRCSGPYYYDYCPSTHHSDAVADCIEFMKKKACRELGGGEAVEDLCCRTDDHISAPASIIDAPGEVEVVVPVPIM